MSQEDDLSANPELCISPSMLSVTAPVTEPASGSTILSVDSHLLDLYYEYFHPSHPFLLPRRSLDTRLRAGPPSPTLQQLTTTMEYIGSFYRHIPIRTELVPGNDASIETDGFVVQNALLRAMAKSMCDDKSGAEVLLARAIQQASLIGMHEKSFADAVADGDPILAESWRRTWWMLYLTDANFSVTRRDFVPIITSSHDVDLPCEDGSYEQMVKCCMAFYLWDCVLNCVVGHSSSGSYVTRLPQSRIRVG